MSAGSSDSGSSDGVIMPEAALDHVTIITDDFESSRPVYDAVLGALGLVHRVEFADPEEEDDDPGTVAAIGYATPDGRTRFWLAAGLTATSGAHLAIDAGSRSSVDAAYDAARAVGAHVVQAPRSWEADQLGYYGMQVADPSGNRLEVLSRRL